MIYPDCRKKLTKDAYPYGMQFRKKEDIPPDEISPYWDGHLDEVDCFFDMLEVYEDFLENVDSNALEDDRLITDIPEEARKAWSRPTLVLKTIHDLLFDYLEASRNGLVVGLIDAEENGKMGNGEKSGEE